MHILFLFITEVISADNFYYNASKLLINLNKIRSFKYNINGYFYKIQINKKRILLLLLLFIFYLFCYYFIFFL